MTTKINHTHRSSIRPYAAPWMMMLKSKLSTSAISCAAVKVRVAATTDPGLSDVPSLSQLNVIKEAVAVGAQSVVVRCRVSVVLPIFFMYMVWVAVVPSLSVPQSMFVQSVVAALLVYTAIPAVEWMFPWLGMVCWSASRAVVVTVRAMAIMINAVAAMAIFVLTIKLS